MGARGGVARSIGVGVRAGGGFTTSGVPDFALIPGVLCGVLRAFAGLLNDEDGEDDWPVVGASNEVGVSDEVANGVGVLAATTSSRFRPRITISAIAIPEPPRINAIIIRRGAMLFRLSGRTEALDPATPGVAG